MVAETAIATGAAAVAANVAGNALYDVLTDDSKESNRLLAEILANLKTADVRTSRAPELFAINPSDGAVVLSTDFRCKYWLFSGCPGDTLGLKIGTYVRIKMITVSGDPQALPLDGLFLASGMDLESVNISTPSDTTFTSYLLGWRE